MVKTSRCFSVKITILSTYWTFPVVFPRHLPFKINAKHIVDSRRTILHGFGILFEGPATPKKSSRRVFTNLNIDFEWKTSNGFQQKINAWFSWKTILAKASNRIEDSHSISTFQWPALWLAFYLCDATLWKPMQKPWCFFRRQWQHQFDCVFTNENYQNVIIMAST